MSALLALLAAITVVITTYNIAIKSKIRDSEEKILTLLADHEIEYLDKELSHVDQDINYLSNSDKLEAIVNHKPNTLSVSNYKSEIKDIEVNYRRFIQSRNNYVQIRLIGIENNGREIFRINKNGSITDIASPKKLVEYGHQPNFREALNLTRGHFYMSMADDDHDIGIVKNNNTVIRFSKPIYRKDKSLFGILAIDIDFKEILKHIADGLINGEHLVIEFPNGKNLFHMYDVKSSDGEDKNQGVFKFLQSTGLESLPEFFAGFSHTDQEINIVSDKVIIHKHFDLMGDQPLHLIIGKEVSQLRNGNIPFLNDNESVFIPILLGIILIALIFTGLPIRQVERLNKTIKSIARGTGSRKDLPVQLNNEIGDLSRSFCLLLDKLEINENELYRAKEQLELAISGAFDGLWDWDVKNNKFDVSKQYLEMIGCDDNTLSVDYETLTNLIHPEDIGRLKEYTDAYFEGKVEKYEIEFKMKHKKGYYLDLLSRGSAVRDESGNIVRLIGINTDITERKQQIRKQIVFEKMQKKALVREVHHRIKNNLQGVASLLRQHVEQKHEYKGELNTAISQVYTMAMVHGIQGKGIDGSIYIEHMLSEIIGITRGITGIQIGLSGINNHCRYRIEEKETVPVALVLNELVTNACKHSKDENPVNIQVACDWCGHEEISIVILNQSLPFQTGFDFSEKTGLGTGLNLVSSLLPPTGSSLDIQEEDGLCRTELVLGKPVIFVESNWEYVKLNQA